MSESHGEPNLVQRMIGEKKRWRAYKARTKQLPAAYRAAVDGIERYLMVCGTSPTDGSRAADMYEGLADLFEQAVENGTSVRNLVGEDPVDFAETFSLAYSDGGWIAKERARLLDAIATAESSGA